MTWPSIREFLPIPKELTGKHVGIAVIDGFFPNHPDIASNEHRHTYIVNLETDSRPVFMTATVGPWNKGLHGLWAAAAAAGSGELSQGRYTGVAPHANLYLLQTGRLQSDEEVESKFVKALNWLGANWRKYHIRGVVLTIASTRDTGLLPWQADPIRILCEKLANDGLLVIAASGNTKELTSNGPASSPSVLSVGGVIVPESAELHQARPYHGCRGKTFEGKWIPEILAPAENVMLPMPSPEGYARTEGTSYAAPMILGCAACIWQAHPHWTTTQVVSAMKGSSVMTDHWKELNAGLVHVAAAVNQAPRDEITDRPYTQWMAWKNKSDAERLQALKGQDEGNIHSALLSFLGEKIPGEIAARMRVLLVHPAYKIRAAAATALAFHPDLMLNHDLQRLLRDDDHYVRMAALFALDRCPAFWNECIDELIRLFSDEDVNIRYCAIKLAGKIKHQRFIDPLVSGLYDDAIHQRVSTFGARCDALENITGISFEPVPEWREGQCWYSDRSTQARLHIARKWLQALDSIKRGGMK